MMPGKQTGLSASQVTNEAFIPRPFTAFHKYGRESFCVPSEIFQPAVISESRLVNSLALLSPFLIFSRSWAPLHWASSSVRPGFWTLIPPVARGPKKDTLC